MENWRISLLREHWTPTQEAMGQWQGNPKRIRHMADKLLPHLGDQNDWQSMLYVACLLNAMKPIPRNSVLWHVRLASKPLVNGKRTRWLPASMTLEACMAYAARNFTAPTAPLVYYALTIRDDHVLGTPVEGDAQFTYEKEVLIAHGVTLKLAENTEIRIVAGQGIRVHSASVKISSR